MATTDKPQLTKRELKLAQALRANLRRRKAEGGSATESKVSETPKPEQ